MRVIDPSKRLANGFQQLLLKFLGPVRVLTQNPDDLTGFTINLYQCVLVSQIYDDRVISRVVLESVAVGPVKVVGKTANMPVSLGQFVADTEWIKMIPCAPAPQFMGATDESNTRSFLPAAQARAFSFPMVFMLSLIHI